MRLVKRVNAAWCRNIHQRHSYADDCWDIVVAAGCGMAVWLRLVHGGAARAVGMRDRDQMLLESGQPRFPADFPDSVAHPVSLPSGAPSNDRGEIGCHRIWRPRNSASASAADWRSTTPGDATAAQPPEGKIHRVGPEFARWPSSLTENRDKRLRVDPDSESPLRIFQVLARRVCRRAAVGPPPLSRGSG